MEIHKVKQRLSKLDEITLLELLEINSFDLVDAFEDNIIMKLDQILDDFDEEDEE